MRDPNVVTGKENLTTAFQDNIHLLFTRLLRVGHRRGNLQVAPSYYYQIDIGLECRKGKPAFTSSAHTWQADAS